MTAGGRVFCATALGDNLKAAQAKAYNLVDTVSFEGAFFRKDIGFKVLNMATRLSLASQAAQTF